ncbi:hypothetical protein [Helicobacter sp. 13S00477-4]|uniref:hypothetical protein n=1 Tax=Helicobacter sp. 13S00477-4 TaxID=1905759 RepID=UPI000BA62E68|nr:hypothetical protein [Helicobacter sp. 13S00477-4]PAF52324.1 hypothetical protein BKH44_03185 [Helicobacter sp. 13S00477-4]
MLNKLFRYFDAYLISKNKKETYIFYILILLLIFCIIHFFFLPPIEQMSNIQRDSYNQIKSILIKNTAQLKEVSQNLKKLDELNIQKNSNQNNPESIKSLEKLSKNNYDLLSAIQNLNTKLHLTITSNIENNKEDISFYLQGKFQDFMEWIRNLEEIYLVFIQDIHIFYEKDHLTYQVHIKNLGSLE